MTFYVIKCAHMVVNDNTFSPIMLPLWHKKDVIWCFKTLSVRAGPSVSGVGPGVGILARADL